MGGFAPAALFGLLQAGLGAAQRAQEVKVTQAAQVEQATLQARQIELARRSESERRARALKEVMSARRARFAAGGVGLDGSAGAVLSGLAVEAAEQERQDADQAQLQIDRINAGLGSQHRRSLLDLTQPLYETGFDAVRRSLSRNSLLR